MACRKYCVIKFLYLKLYKLLKLFNFSRSFISIKFYTQDPSALTITSVDITIDMLADVIQACLYKITFFYTLLTNYVRISNNSNFLNERYALSFVERKSSWVGIHVYYTVRYMRSTFNERSYTNYVFLFVYLSTHKCISVHQF